MTRWCRVCERPGIPVVRGTGELETYSVEAFISRIWTLRDNLSICDAWYVALAEALQVRLITTDGWL